MTERYDTLVIGGGMAGLPLALRAARHGRVAFAEREKLGGTCLNRGCIPAKTMIAPAAVARQVRRAGEFGVRAAAPQADLAAVAGRKDRIAESIRSGSYHAAGRAEGLDFYQAEGRFTGLRRFRLPGNLVHEAVIAMVTGATRADIARPPSTSTPARVARQAHAQGCHAGSTRPADLDLSAQWKA